MHCVFIFAILLNTQVGLRTAVEYDQTIEFISDFWKFSRKATPSSKVTTFLCWPDVWALRLHRSLSAAGALTSAHTDCRWPRPRMPAPGEAVLFILDTECSCALPLLLQANQSKLLDPPTSWLLLRLDDDDDDEEELVDEPWRGARELAGWLESLDRLHVHVSSQVWVASRGGSQATVLLTEVYRRGVGQRALRRLAATWRPGEGRVRAVLDLAVARRRADLHGTPIRVVVVITNNVTMNHLTDLENKHIDTISKLGYALAAHAVEMMNATMKLRYDQSWGYLVNGSWDGIVGFLERDEADMGSTAVLYTEERAKVVHYLIMTTPTKLGFVFRQPPLSSVRNVFVMPFTSTVWLCSAALLLLFGTMLLAALRWERMAADGDYRRPVQQVTWTDVVLLSVGALCQQGSPVESKGTPGRIVSMQLFIFVIFLYTSYSACIVALLQSSTNTIQTLKDLLDSRMKLAVHDIVYNRYFFERADEPVRKAIYERKIAPPGVQPRFIGLADGVERMRRGMFAFHFEVGTGYKLVLDTFQEDEKCGLTRIPYIQVVDAYQVIQKGSVYKEILAIAYNKLIERGFQKRNWNRYYTGKPECNSHGSSFMSVGLIDCYPVLVVLLMGCVTASVILVLEILAHKRKKFHQRMLRAVSKTTFHAMK